MAAFDILQGMPKIWWTIGGGKEPLWPYLVAAGTAVWGNIPFTLRLLAAFVGIVTVAAVYPLVYRFFRRTGRRPAQEVAWLAMLGLAVSDWHLHFSRLGFRAILLPLLSALGFYFLWRFIVRACCQPQAANTKSYASHLRLIFQPSLLLSSFFIALSIYAYLAGRLLPLVPLLFLILHGSILKIRGTSLPSALGDYRRLRFLISNFLFLTFLLLTPLIIYFIFNPADFWARSAAVSIFNPDVHQNNFIETAWQTLALTLGTFFGFSGDTNALVNLPGQPVLPFFLAPFFVLGFVLSLYRVFRPADRTPSPHLFFLCWWLVMLLPALLAPEGAPHHLRLLGTIVPTYVFVAFGLVIATRFLAGWLAHFLHNRQYILRIAYLLPAVCYLLLTAQTYTHYFVYWPARTDFTLPFDLYAVRLADQIAHAPPDVAYILPMDIRAGLEARHYTLDYLLASRQADYTYLPVNAANAELILNQTAAGKDQLRVVRWTDDKHRAADEKEIVSYLLETQAQPVGQESFPVYDVETYALTGPTDFILPAIDHPVGAVFDGLLRLEAAFLPAKVPQGERLLPVALTLAPLTPMEVDYKISLRLLSPAGQRVAQQDRTLRHDFHQGTSLWPPEPVNEYYLLPVPPDLPAGDYTVAAVIYHPETQTPLVFNGLVEVPLGQVRLVAKDSCQG